MTPFHNHRRLLRETQSPTTDVCYEKCSHRQPTSATRNAVADARLQKTAFTFQHGISRGQAADYPDRRSTEQHLVPTTMEDVADWMQNNTPASPSTSNIAIRSTFAQQSRVKHANSLACTHTDSTCTHICTAHTCSTDRLTCLAHVQQMQTQLHTHIPLHSTHVYYKQTHLLNTRVALATPHIKSQQTCSFQLR